MGGILKAWRITLAAIFSVVLIVGASLLARDAESPRSVSASEESGLLQAIATKDSDGDGLPDWEEALYGANPRMTDTFNLGMTDGEAVARGLIVPKAIADISVTTSLPASLDSEGLPPPAAEGTLTDAFARNLFALYLSSKQTNGGANLSEGEMAAITKEALNSLSSIITVAPDFKSAKDLKISGSGPDAFKTFAAQAEAVLMKNTSNATTSEINYLKSALENDDATALPHIVSIAKAYRDSAAGLAMIPVPKELAADHLLLINTVMRMGQIASDFARVNDDPLATMLALQQYPQTIIALSAAFVHIGNIYKTVGVSLPVDTPGSGFINLARDTNLTP